MTKVANTERTAAVCNQYRAMISSGESAGRAVLELSFKYEVQRPAIWKILRRGGVLPPYAPRKNGGQGRPIGGGVAGYTQSRIDRSIEGRQPVPERIIDRDPCFLCGIRADLGCKHRALA